MTIAEFKAWLEGFETSVNGAPDKEQWEAIKKKVENLRDSEQVIPMTTPYRFPDISGPWWESPVITWSADSPAPAHRGNNRL